jgi:hypothetical protein
MNLFAINAMMVIENFNPDKKINVNYVIRDALNAIIKMSVKWINVLNLIFLILRLKNVKHVQ